MACGRCIELAFERCDQAIVGRFVRTWRTKRRHHAEPQLPHHFLPAGTRLRNAIERRRLEHESACFQPCVVTRDAVLIEGRLQLRIGRRLGTACSHNRTPEDNQPERETKTTLHVAADCTAAMYRRFHTNSV